MNDPALGLTLDEIRSLAEVAIVANSDLYGRAYRAKHEGGESPTEYEVRQTVRASVAAVKTVPRSDVLRAELVLMHAAQICEWTGVAVPSVEPALAEVRATPAYRRLATRTT